MPALRNRDSHLGSALHILHRVSLQTDDNARRKNHSRGRLPAQPLRGLGGVLRIDPMLLVIGSLGGMATAQAAGRPQLVSEMTPFLLDCCPRDLAPDTSGDQHRLRGHCGRSRVPLASFELTRTIAVTCLADLHRPCLGPWLIIKLCTLVNASPLAQSCLAVS